MQAVALLRMPEDKHNLPKFVACRIGFKCREHLGGGDELTQYVDIGLVYNLPSCFVFLLFSHNSCYSMDFLVRFIQC